MIKVVCDRGSSTAAEIQDLLKDVPESGIVNWTGAPMEVLDRPVINSKSRTDKLWAVKQLSDAGVRTVDFSEGERPKDGEWLGRTRLHRKGFDLVNSRGRTRVWKSVSPDFWTRKEDFIDEYRCHVFICPDGGYKVIRSAVRLPMGPGSHPWVKSHRLGWRFSYTGMGGDAGRRMRDLARAAVNALGLDFGAVDLGLKGDETALVLEVNSCPQMEGNTLEMYAEYIRALAAARQQAVPESHDSNERLLTWDNLGIPFRPNVQIVPPVYCQDDDEEDYDDDYEDDDDVAVDGDDWGLDDA